jgi:hypothetical protein
MTPSASRVRREPPTRPGAFDGNREDDQSAAATLARFRRYDSGMTAQPASAPDGHEQIHLGGETAVIVPLEEYRVLAALRAQATPEDIEEALFDAAIAEDRAWKAAGCPGGTIPHDEVMNELLKPSGGWHPPARG